MLKSTEYNISKKQNFRRYDHEKFDILVFSNIQLN